MSKQNSHSPQPLLVQMFQLILSVLIPQAIYVAAKYDYLFRFGAALATVGGAVYNGHYRRAGI